MKTQPLSAPIPIQLAEQVRCVEREISFREFVYPRRVRDNKMTGQKADYELDVMRAVLATLRALEAKDRLL